MKTEKELEDLAKESYDKYFKDPTEKTDDEYRGHDVVLDKEAWEKEMSERKEQEEEKLEKLSELRHEIDEKAEESYEETFGKADE